MKGTCWALTIEVTGQTASSGSFEFRHVRSSHKYCWRRTKHQLLLLLLLLWYLHDIISTSTRRTTNNPHDE
jgi:hypothetical protein